MTAELISDLIREIEEDLASDVFDYADSGQSRPDHANCVYGYVRQLKMILKVEQSKPVIAQPIGQISKGDIDVLGCCNRFADNKACDCLEKAI